MTEKTEKQVVSGFHRPVCTRCCCELHPETNGVGVLDTDSNGNPYELFDADLWKCPVCGIEVVGGFGHGPVSAHYESDFKKSIDFYQRRGILINNRG